MKTYTYEVNLVVKVEAFDDSDSWDAIQDNFGIGELSGGVTVIDCEYQEVRKPIKE